MKAILHLPGSGKQRGFSLVEMMIGITLGSVLLLALAYYYVGSRQLNRTHDDVSRMQESGRNALEILGRAIRQTGYRANLGAFTGALAGTNGSPDTITVQYNAQAVVGEANCAGVIVAAGGLMTHAFTVNAGTRTLLCNGNVVANNIEDMQITYGIDTPPQNGVIALYTATPTAAQFGQVFAVPGEVAAVRINLLVRGPTRNAATGNQTYLFNGAPGPTGDGFLRQVYTVTFTVRNQAG